MEGQGHGGKPDTVSDGAGWSIAEKSINIYATFNDQSFNDTLINDIFSFAHLHDMDPH